MKRKSNLYQNICSLENIIKEAKSIKIKNKVKKEKFNDFFSMNVIGIYNELNRKTYKVGKYNIFKIYELDHFIKEKLKIKYYLKYMDDFILIHESKEYLQYCLEKIEEILKEYKLELNNKTKIYTKKEGVTFLGFHFKIKNNKVIITLKNETKRKFKKRMKLLNKLYNNNIITKEELKQTLASYKGHLSKGKCYRLYKGFSCS